MAQRIIWKPVRVAAAVEGLHRGERSDLTAPKVRMVIDASELGIEAVIYAILGVLVSVPLAGLLIAVVASGLGGRRFGFGSIGMGIVVSVAALVVVVVLLENDRWRGDRLGSALGGRLDSGRSVEPA